MRNSKVSARSSNSSVTLRLLKKLIMGIADLKKRSIQHTCIMFLEIACQRSFKGLQDQAKDPK